MSTLAFNIESKEVLDSQYHFGLVNNIEINKNYKDSELEFPCLIMVKHHFDKNKKICRADFTDVKTLIEDLEYQTGSPELVNDLLYNSIKLIYHIPSELSNLDSVNHYDDLYVTGIIYDNDKPIGIKTNRGEIYSKWIVAYSR